MRTTVRLEDDLLRNAKREASRREITLTAVLEEALREWLSRQKRRLPRARIDLPVSHAGGGLQPGVDLDDSAGLLDRMDAGDPA